MAGMLSLHEVAQEFNRHLATVMIATQDGALHALRNDEDRSWAVHRVCAVAWAKGLCCPHMEQSARATNTRANDPETSHEADRSVKVTHSKDYVLQTLRVFGPLADHELVELHADDRAGQKAFGRFSAQRLRSARADLVREGLIEEVAGVFRNTDSGRRAHVWRAAPRGQ